MKASRFPGGLRQASVQRERLIVVLRLHGAKQLSVDDAPLSYVAEEIGRLRTAVQEPIGHH
ncbi:hypothetical protein [Phyllobacterium sp. SB3]|uniref:hypothetical protein n=1 Tax=Phyllobacterium sp. SB3 TaxID=3156073 RepID=UPI0032AF57C6